MEVKRVITKWYWLLWDHSIVCFGMQWPLPQMIIRRLHVGSYGHHTAHIIPHTALHRYCDCSDTLHLGTQHLTFHLMTPSKQVIVNHMNRMRGGVHCAAWGSPLHLSLPVPISVSLPFFLFFSLWYCLFISLPSHSHCDSLHFLLLITADVSLWHTLRNAFQTLGL